MKTRDMTPEEVKDILSHIKDKELRDGLADIFQNELLGSRGRQVNDLGRMRR